MPKDRVDFIIMLFGLNFGLCRGHYLILPTKTTLNPATHWRLPKQSTNALLVAILKWLINLPKSKLPNSRRLSPCSIRTEMVSIGRPYLVSKDWNSAPPHHVAARHTLHDRTGVAHNPDPRGIQPPARIIIAMLSSGHGGMGN